MRNLIPKFPPYMHKAVEKREGQQETKVGGNSGTILLIVYKTLIFIGFSIKFCFPNSWELLGIPGKSWRRRRWWFTSPSFCLGAYCSNQYLTESI